MPRYEADNQVRYRYSFHITRNYKVIEYVQGLILAPTIDEAKEIIAQRFNMPNKWQHVEENRLIAQISHKKPSLFVPRYKTEKVLIISDAFPHDMTLDEGMLHAQQMLELKKTGKMKRPSRLYQKINDVINRELA